MEKSKLEHFTAWQFRMRFIAGVVFAFTSPVIHIYCIQQVSEDFFKVICFLDEMLSLIIMFGLDKRDKDGNPTLIIKMRMYFYSIIVIGSLMFIIANLSGLFDVRFRFILLATTSGVSNYLWMTMMRDLWNNLMDGTTLTAFDNRSDKYDRLGAFIGAITIIFCHINIEFAIGAQCLCWCLYGFIDWYIYKNCRKEAFNEDKATKE